MTTIPLLIFTLLVDLLEECASQIHITCVHVIRCENKFNHDFTNNCLIKVAMEKCLGTLSEIIREQKCYTNNHSLIYSFNKNINWTATCKRMK